MARQRRAITVVIPDTTPFLTLAAVDRLSVFSLFTVPIVVVDIVSEEAQRPENDVTGRVRRWFEARPNNVSIAETTVGLGLATKRGRGERPPTGNLGEIAVDEFASAIAKRGDPNQIPLIWFEDPDILELRIARLKNAHLLNTAGLLLGLQRSGLLSDAADILQQINAVRKSPMAPVDRPARTTKITSDWTRSTRGLKS